MAQVVAARSGYACNNDADCKGDRVCEAGKCVSPRVGPMRCQNDRDCQGDDVCEGEICVAPGSPAAANAAPAANTTMPAGAPAPAAQSPAPAYGAPATQGTEPAAQPYGVPPAPGAPVAASAANAAVPPAKPSPPTKLPGAKDEFSSIAIMLPNADHFLGIGGHREYRIDSMSSLMWTVTAGGVYEGLFYTGGGDINVYTQAVGMTLGVRPAPAMFLSGALRAGAVAMVTHSEIGSQSSNDFSAALLVGADLMIGYVTIGAEGWLRDGSMWMLRGGVAW